jgi:hypothetical protein
MARPFPPSAKLLGQPEGQEGLMMQIAVLGIDLGKNSCSAVGLDAAGRVVLKRRLHRDGVVKLAAGLPLVLSQVSKSDEVIFRNDGLDYPARE